MLIWRNLRRADIAAVLTAAAPPEGAPPLGEADAVGTRTDMRRGAEMGRDPWPAAAGETGSGR